MGREIEHHAGLSLKTETAKIILTSNHLDETFEVHIYGDGGAHSFAFLSAGEMRQFANFVVVETKSMGV